MSVRVVLATALAVSLTLPYAASAQTATCVGGVPSHTATADEAASVTNGSIIAGDTQVCPGDAQLGINADVGQARQQLNSMWCGGKAARCGPYTSSVEELDPKFAVCAANFIAALRQRDPSICMASAYRSTTHQSCVCSQATGPCAPAGRSKHQQGLAIDIEKPRYNTLPSWVHQLASQGSGISFPVRNDDGHMQPASSSGDCSTPGYIAPDSGSGPAPTPLGGFTEMIRQYLGGGQRPDTGAVPTTGATPATGEQPFTAQRPSTTAVPATTGIGGTTAIPGGGSVPVSGNPVTIAVPTPGYVSETLDSGTRTGSTSNSSIDLINALANPKPTSSNSPSAPLALNSDLQNTSGAQQPTPSGSASAQGGTYTLAPAGTQTFTSQDLQYTDSEFGTSNETFTMRTLKNIKQILLAALSWVRPFGQYGTPLYEYQDHPAGFEYRE